MGRFLIINAVLIAAFFLLRNAKAIVTGIVMIAAVGFGLLFVSNDMEVGKTMSEFMGYVMMVIDWFKDMFEEYGGYIKKAFTF